MAKISQVNRNARREKMAKRDKAKRQALKEVLMDRTLPMTEAREGFAAMLDGDQFGKIVFTR